jgi:CHAT domain
MAELHFKRTGETLTVTFADHQAVVAWTEIALNEHTAQRIYDDAGAYGHTLFEQVIRDEGLRSALLALPVNERLALHIEDPEVAAIPWEYLRDPNDMLLAARFNMVRYIEGKPRPLLAMTQSLSIVAVPVSPVDEAHPLNTEQEWLRLTEAITAPQKALSLLRVRPPTLAQLEQTLPGEGISIVHFMGHSGMVQGKSILEFEDPRGRSQRIDAAYFADALDEQVVLVVLNSCLSAVAIPTEFGNIARAVVRQGVPYALGMQFVLLDDAALEISKTLYKHLLQGRSIEEAVRRVRRAVEQNMTLHHPQWIAGIPVLSTHLREPAPAILLETGKPMISPDPAQLQVTCDLTALPQALHFVDRSSVQVPLLFLESTLLHEKRITTPIGCGRFGLTCDSR